MTMTLSHAPKRISAVSWLGLGLELELGLWGWGWGWGSGWNGGRPG